MNKILITLLLPAGMHATVEAPKYTQPAPIVEEYNQKVLATPIENDEFIPDSDEDEAMTPAEEIAELDKIVEEKDSQIKALMDQVAELERQLNE